MHYFRFRNTLFIVTNCNSFVIEHPLHNVTICDKRNYVLNECSNENPMQLISVRYVECTCSCESCKTLHVPNACVSPDVFKEISEECEGKASCKVKRPDVPCDFQHVMAIDISYDCYSQNRKYDGDDEEDDEDDEEDGEDDEEDDEEFDEDDEEDDEEDEEDDEDDDEDDGDDEKDDEEDD